MNIISYGGGVQSTALIVLAAQGRIAATHAVFANTGDDSEHPATLEYVRNVAAPWAAEHGVEVVEVSRKQTLLENVTGDGRSVNIPIYMEGGAPGNRNCTAEWKIKVIERWLRQQGATVSTPATVHIGISMDEIHRLNNRRPSKLQEPTYPLIDLRLHRQDCMNIIAAAGLPVPPKSSCWFCPFKRKAQWQEMRRDEPELFARAIALEERINVKRAGLGKDNVYLSTWLKPLSEVAEAQQDLWSVMDDSCDSGYCMV